MTKLSNAKARYITRNDMSEPRRGIVVGTGMLATAFQQSVLDGPDACCVFASGVSNSACVDPAEFARECELLVHSLELHDAMKAFVYFGTCAAAVPGNETSPYVLHKMAMESLVLSHPNGRVVRLPQVAGPNASPYTLLSVLCNRIKSGLPVVVRDKATRNIIDVADVVLLVNAWLSAPGDQPRRINVANMQSYPILSIVETIESELGIKGEREILAAGEPYEVDTTAIAPLMGLCGVTFGTGYLARIIARYYK